jgi:hypothetical protein
MTIDGVTYYIIKNMYGTIEYTHLSEEPISSPSCCAILGVALLSFTWFLYFILSAFLTILFIELNIEDYKDIPNCASPYRTLSPLVPIITGFTTVALVIALQHKHLRISRNDLAFGSWMVSILLFLVAELFRHYPPGPSCDLSAIVWLSSLFHILVPYHIITAVVWFWVGTVACVLSPPN